MLKKGDKEAINLGIINYKFSLRIKKLYSTKY